MLTMHGAKGLEFPIVVLGQPGRRPPPGGEALPPWPRTGLHLVGWGSATSGHFATPGYDEAWEHEKAAQAAERLRLLYVAATRARDHLVVPVVGDREKANGLLRALLDFVPAEGDEDARGCFAYDRALVDGAERGAVAADDAVPETDAEVAREERSSWPSARDELRTTAGRELPYVTATSIEKPWRPLSVAAEDIDGSLVAGKGPPLPIGDALHRTMELVSLPDAEDLEEVARAVCEEADLAEHVDEVLAMARNCLASAVVQRALQSGRWWREVPFATAEAQAAREIATNGNGSTSRGGYTSGRVDLVFGEPDGLVVVDYKTDQHAGNGSALGHAHRDQGNVYLAAAETATGLPVLDVVLLSARTGSEHSVR